MEIGKVSTRQEWPSYYPPQYTLTMPSSPTIKKFKGGITTVSDLPKSANVGDAYYITESGILVVRVTDGWHHFD